MKPTLEPDMPHIERVLMIVLDSAGVGELPDAANFNDLGSNTVGHVARAVGGLFLPNLQRLGLGNIIHIDGVPPADSPLASWGKMAEKSAGKDTTTGHWEIAGVVTPRPFPIYPEGFPPEVTDRFEAAIGRRIIGNYPASGTEIIKELGEEHMLTGRPIVYTSADSVFQIACHEEVVPVEKLYEWCAIARDILREPHDVLRVIARPFVGRPGEFVRTERRRDFSFPPPGRTVLDAICESGGEVIGVGKIEDVFAGRGITQAIHTTSNCEGMKVTSDAVLSGKGRLIFTNLVDFDMLYGHRNDTSGYARALEAFDEDLGAFLGTLGSRDLLIITADHGCDPTTPGTDHTREYVPLLAYTPSAVPGRDLGTRQSFCDVASTLAHLFGLPGFDCGCSFAPMLLTISPSNK